MNEVNDLGVKPLDQNVLIRMELEVPLIDLRNGKKLTETVIDRFIVAAIGDGIVNPAFKVGDEVKVMSSALVHVDVASNDNLHDLLVSKYDKMQKEDPEVYTGLLREGHRVTIVNYGIWVKNSIACVITKSRNVNEIISASKANTNASKKLILK